MVWNTFGIPRCRKDWHWMNCWIYPWKRFQVRSLHQNGLRLSLFFVAFILTFILSSSGCSSQSNSLRPLKIGTLAWPGYDVILYAQSEKLFEKHGLTVELMPFENSQDAARAVLRGKLDMAFATLWDTMQVDPGNDKPAFVLVTDISHGADGIVAQPEIESIAALRGKQIGAQLGTINHLILLEALQLYNVEPEAVDIVNVSNETAIQLMKAGKLDAAVLWEPTLSEIDQSTDFNTIYTTKDIDSIVIDGVMTRSELLQTKKEELTAFALTWLDVMHAIETMPDKVFTIVSEQIGQSTESFAKDYGGIKKGDTVMQQRMFQQGKLKAVVPKFVQLLQADPRHGRIPREDIIIDGEAVMTAMEIWKP
jgi:NitT/TauT family transport system substrate-binding protein